MVGDKPHANKVLERGDQILWPVEFVIEFGWRIYNIFWWMASDSYAGSVF